MDTPTICIVEDEGIIAADIRSLLLNLGYQISGIASSGEEALDILKKHPTDLVLMDIRIKGAMNGIETTEKINKMYDIPVIFLTAYADDDTIARIKKIDVYGFIVKPANQQTIQGSIQLAIFKHRLNRQLRDREEKLIHLNQVLHAIRNVDQLITKETDRKKLIKGACYELVETMGYQSVWIELISNKGQYDQFAHAGLDPTLQKALEKALKTKHYPPCMIKAMEKDTISIISNPAKECPVCSQINKFKNHSCFSMALKYQNAFYGIFSVGILKHFAEDFNEQELFIELANDVAFALYRIDLEEKRSQAEDALRRSEKKYRDLAELLPQTIFEMNTEGRITYANVNGLKMFGYSQEDINNGIYLPQILTPESLQKGYKIMQQMLNGKGHTGNEYSAFRKDGSEFDIVIYNSPVFKQDKHLGWRGTVIDITKQKQTEKALKDNQTLLKKMAENYPNSYISIIEKDLTIGYTSGQEFKKRNLDPNAFIGLPLKTVFGKHTSIVKKHYLRTFKGEETSFELFIDNQHQLYKTVPLYDEDGTIDRILVVVENITERKNAEQALRESQERLSQFINSASDSFYLLDSKLNFIEVNKKGLEIIGKSRKEVIGKHITEIVPDVKSSGRYKKHQEVLRTGKSFTIEHFVPHPLFGDRHFILKSFKVGDGLGVIATDITERKHAEENLKTGQEQLQYIINKLPILLAYIASDQKYIYVNQAYAEWYGLSQEKIIGKSIKDILNPDSYKDAQKHIRLALRGEEVFYENVAYNLSGQKRIVKASHIPHFDESGKVKAFLALIEDITKQKEMESLIQKLK